MVQLRGTRILTRSFIVGLFALSKKDVGFRPAPPLFAEGSYEYTKFGYTVSTPITIEDSGIQNAK